MSEYTVAKVLAGVHASWRPVLAQIESQLAAVLAAVEMDRAAGKQILPEPSRVFAALAIPFESVKVLIIGQDPYPTAGHPIGVAFGCDARVRPLPASLRNIFAELQSDLGAGAPASGDLSPWVAQGVLLLNTALTVREGEAGSHTDLGWSEIVEHLVRALVAREDAAGEQAPVVAILWGKHAGSFASLLSGESVRILESAHPSPLSARRGFFGSRPFSQTNELLTRLGVDPVDWSLPSADVTPLLF